ncbi:MAG: NUDIX hydrolase [Phycisphaerales bacterium]
MNTKGTYIYEWPRPMVTVDAIVFNTAGAKPRLLMIRRGNEPYKGKWAFPGGFVDMDEELQAAVVRELQEETGLTGVKLKQFHTFGKCGRDPRGRNITIAFMGITKTEQIKGGDDAAEAKWYEIDALPENLAFDHKDVADLAIKHFKEND